MKTPKVEKIPNEIADKEKTSGKKLVQARLPFKTLATPPPSELSSSKKPGKDLNEARKRKLSFDKNESAVEQVAKKKPIKISESKRNKGDKNKKELAKKSSDVVVLSDSDDDNDCNKSYSKENVKTPIAATVINNIHNQLESDKEADLHSDDVEIEVSSDEEPKKSETATECAIKSTPKTIEKCESKLKTPKSAQKATSTVKERKITGDATAESKVLIKLPISTKKNKRRKTSIQAAVHVKELANSDEIELTSPNQLQKRAKLEDDTEQQGENEKPNVNKDQNKVKKSDEKLEQVEVTEKKGQIEYETNKTEGKEEKSKEPTKANSKNIKDNENIEKNTEVINVEENENGENDDNNKLQVDLEEGAPIQSTKVSIPESEEEITSGSDTNKSKILERSNTSTDLEADAETETTNKTDVLQHETKTQTSNEMPTTPKTLNENTSNKLQKKNLTPKQQKLLEQRLKAREEKERKIQEERLQKQREKEERELAKKREREEKEEFKRKEREEKEEQRRKEREEKERKRLAELELKNEEKRKRNEAKEEELRKKEEDRKRKEQEKEEAELKKKKAALAFTKFFSRPANKNVNEQIKVEHVPENVVLAFRPFQIKGAMRLAPIQRKNLNNEARSLLDTILKESKELNQTELYVKELKKGLITPHKWIAPVQKDDAEEIKQLRESHDDDVIIVEDELERAGQAIVEEPVVPVERLRVKFYSFHENRRPPYYGTWRKKSKVITARRPFAQDKQFFDYEVDSDDEWEEEEPGESLDGSDDDKEKESEDEDYEVDNDWFVPHGHLSEEEIQGEDDLGENNDREAQKAKLQILQKEFAQEMKKKTEKIKPRLIGCIWVDENGNQPELCPKIIWDTLNTRAILCAEPPILEEIEVKIDKDNETGMNGEKTNEKTTGENKLKPISLTEPMLKKLVKLVHGNTHSKNFLIQEFIAYIEANEESVRNGDVKGPLKSAVREKIDQFAQWQIVEKSENEKNDANTNSSKKKKNKKKLCWVVSDEALQKMDMETLNLINDWEYILTPNKSKAKTTTKTDISSIALTSNGDDSNEHSEASVEQNVASPSTKVKLAKTTDIKKFTKVLTAEEKAQKLEKSNEIIKTPSSKKAVATTTTTSVTPTTITANTDTKSLTPTTKNTNAIKSNNNNNNNTTPTVKKRVPLLMSVARGQAISTPDKNARISKFLKTLNDAKQQKENNKTAINEATQPISMEVDDVVVLDD